MSLTDLDAATEADLEDIHEEDTTGRIDVVVVHHNDRNREEHGDLVDQLAILDPSIRVIGVDNSDGRGFAAGCNVGAREATTRIIGFLNPDVHVSGPLTPAVLAAFTQPNVAITGCDFGKTLREVRAWGLRAWVCGAAMFVRRDFFADAGGFHEGYLWGFEDTDLCAVAQAARRLVVPIALPIVHESPEDNTVEDAAFKRSGVDAGKDLYSARWGIPRRQL